MCAQNAKNKVDENFINDEISQKKAQQIMNLTIKKTEIENEYDENSIASKKNIKFQKLLKLFNFHVDFYFSLMTREFCTIINCNVLFEKMKHKYSMFLYFHRREVANLKQNL